MRWIDFCRRTGRRAEPNIPAAADGNVNDELMFHFRELIHERLAGGLSFEAAWEDAQRQFGPLRRYESECHDIQLQRRLTWRTAGAGALMLLAVLAGLWISGIPGRAMNDEVRILRQDLQALQFEQHQRLAQVNVAGDDGHPAEGVDLTGVVFGEDDKPLRDATVLVILKTWPDGAYQQEAFTATTGAEGRFHLPALIPSRERYAIQVAALKEGFAFHSDYQLKLTWPISKPDPIVLRLEPASHVTLIVRDGSGRPVPNAHVFPSARNSRIGDNHYIYFQGSEPAHRTTDAEGRVRLNYFRTGDQAEIYLRLPGDDWDIREFEVTNDDAVIDLASSG